MDLNLSSGCSPHQARLAGKIHDYAAVRLGERVTIGELSAALGLSPTQIKSSFKTAMGVPVCSYIRLMKMHHAAQLLVSTEKTVLDIAGSLGYDNASKFAAAFRSVMGLSPREYRSRRSKNRNAVLLERNTGESFANMQE